MQTERQPPAGTRRDRFTKRRNSNVRSSYDDPLGNPCHSGFRFRLRNLCPGNIFRSAGTGGFKRNFGTHWFCIGRHGASRTSCGTAGLVHGRSLN